ncbi:MAG: Polysaccharide deacetylase [Syntrophorhabdus sp. PtaB.Bin006]|nr:MAG: Polysaccharide deacetylase [Syntrophorhabdus sp. PtaB.Bin006]
MNYLKNSFRVVRLSEAVHLLKNDQLTEPTVAITFDDGFMNNYTLAFPVLYELGIPATIFLTTGLIDTDNTVWFTKLVNMIETTNEQSLTVNGRHFLIDTPANKFASSVEMQAFLKAMPHQKLLEEIERIKVRLGCESSIDKSSPFRMLDAHAINEMVVSGLIEFGAHTHNHAILSYLDEEHKLFEIENSIKAVSNLTGQPCILFAYPNGGQDDYDSQAMHMLESIGIQGAVTMVSGPNYYGMDALQLRRYGIGCDLSFQRFTANLYHFIWLVKTLDARRFFGRQ